MPDACAAGSLTCKYAPGSANPSSTTGMWTGQLIPLKLAKEKEKESRDMPVARRGGAPQIFPYGLPDPLGWPQIARRHRPGCSTRPAGCGGVQDAANPRPPPNGDGIHGRVSLRSGAPERLRPARAGHYVDHWKPRYPGAPDALGSAAGRWLTALTGNSSALAGRATGLPFWRLRPLVV